MKITCPKCGKAQKVKKEDLMGWHVVCRKCSIVFSWKKIDKKKTCAMRPDAGFHDSELYFRRIRRFSEVN
jgi:hypothetical protein